MKRALLKRIKCLSLIVLIMIAVHVVNSVFNGALTVFGIIPGSRADWWHIFTAPFIHGSLAHLSNNLVAFLIFASLCMTQSVRFFATSSLFIIAMSGALVWLFGRETIHIGASGWIFGLWSLSIALAWYDRSFINILVACLVVFFYGGMIYGVLPSDPKISFEAHLFGAISGVVWAGLYSGYLKRFKTISRSLG